MPKITGVDGQDYEVYTIYLINPHSEYAVDANAHHSLRVRLVEDEDTAAEKDEKAGRSEGGWEEALRKVTPEGLEARGKGKEHIGYSGSMNFGRIEKLVGPVHALRAGYERLLADLATPSWHWYGMGGDDHCYDYWPNSMEMALDYLNALIEAVRLDGGEERWDWEYYSKYMRDDLNRVYWLCRTRYSRATNDGTEAKATDQKDALADGDAYFEDAILSSERFGPRPAWLMDPERGEKGE
jgi:hypothetical protein